MRPRATTTLYRVLAICCLCQVVLGDQPVAPERRYDLGPLTIDEFVGEVKPGSRAQANTATRVSYSYRYTLRQVGRRMVVSVTSIDLSAVFLPKDSWWG